MDQDEEDNKGLLWIVPAVGVVLAVVLGVAVQQVRGHAQATSATAKSATAVEAAPQADQDAASVVVADGWVTLYFASAKADVATGAAEALSAAVAAAQAGKTLVLSGYHDASGDPAFNADLAKRRVFAVRDVLLQSGVDEARIRLEKPQELVGSGSPAQARRVEVVMVD